MKKLFTKSILAIILVFSFSCEDLNDDINSNPNDILISDVEDRLFLTGSQLANIQIQLGHLNRISGMYSGQLIGFTSLYANIYGYSLSTVEANGTWNSLYVGVLTNMKQIQENSSNSLLVGISEIIEGHAFGTAASLWGDIPYGEAGNPEIEDPVFDSQVSVYTAAIQKLNSGISTLQSVSGGSLSQDIYFGGDKNKWIEAAYTLIARFNLHQKNYSAAVSAANNGISSESGDMKYDPPASQNSGDVNLFATILNGSRSGDLGNKLGDTESYLLQLLNSSNSINRNNSKTDETARYNYYIINNNSGSANTGIISEDEPQNMATYFENELILAEAKARQGGVADGLPHLNKVRAWLNSGGNINTNHSSKPYKYEAYVAEDFNSGGVENQDGVDAKTAFLREVIEERYVSGFGMHIPFNDARRLRASDAAYSVPFVLVDGPNPPYPERMPWSYNELNSNSNAPSSDPGIFVKTEVNQ